MPKDNLNKKSGFVTESKAKIEQQIKEQSAQTTKKIKRGETSGLSQPDMDSTRQTQASDRIVYAELAFDTAQSIKEPVKDSTEYAEILLTGYIGQSEKLLKLVEDIKVINREIAGIEKLKEINQSASDLAVIEEALKDKHDSKLNLHTELLEIRQSFHNEFNINFQRLQKKETEIEEKIKDTHGDFVKFNQLKSELFNTRNEHIRLIEKKLEFEQALHQISQDGLKTETETELFTLHQTELGLQYKLKEGLSDEKAVIEQNFQLHAKNTPEFKQYSEMYIMIVNKLESCHNRIFILEDEITTREKAFQSEAVEFGEIGALNINFPSILKENPCYEKQLEPQAQGGTNLPGSNVNSPEKSEEGLVEQQHKGAARKYVHFTLSTLEREDLKKKKEFEEKQGFTWERTGAIRKKPIASQSEALSSKEEKQKQSSERKLSSVRQPHKQLLDQQFGCTSSTLFSFQQSQNQKKEEKEEEKEVKSKKRSIAK